MPVPFLRPLVVALTLGLPVAGLAEQPDATLSCDAKARKVSGHVPGLIPPVRLGPMTLKITGEVALGVSNSRGAFATSPRGGEGQRMLRRERAEQEYNRVYADCLAGR